MTLVLSRLSPAPGRAVCDGDSAGCVCVCVCLGGGGEGWGEVKGEGKRDRLRWEEGHKCVCQHECVQANKAVCGACL